MSTTRLSTPHVSGLSWQVKPALMKLPVSPVVATGEIQEFLTALNQFRSGQSLHTLIYNINLEKVSSTNNFFQRIFGLGHYYTKNTNQVAGWNYPTASAMLQGWLASPGHRAILLNPVLSLIGAAHSGAYWTASLL